MSSFEHNLLCLCAFSCTIHLLGVVHRRVKRMLEILEYLADDTTFESIAIDDVLRRQEQNAAK